MIGILNNISMFILVYLSLTALDGILQLWGLLIIVKFLMAFRQVGCPSRVLLSEDCSDLWAIYLPILDEMFCFFFPLLRSVFMQFYFTYILLY